MAMTDRKIEEYLAQAISKNTPDMLADLLRDIDRIEEPLAVKAEEPGKVWEEVRAAKNDAPAHKNNGKAGRRSLRAVMSIAAVFVLLIGGVGVFNHMNMQSTYAVVGLDVNPSVELTINKDEVVTEAIAVNEEGEDIINDMDLRDTDVNIACNAIVGAMLKKGYLTNTSNSVLVSVRATDAARGREIEKKLAGDLNSYLGNSSVAASVLGQYVEEDDELEAFAEANGISEGKAWLIRNLLATGSTKMTEESLLKLSTQELILLAQERNAGTDAAASYTSYGTADTSKYIGKDKAADAALAAAGVSRSQASGIKVEYDSDNGIIMYEVEFTAGGIEYEYDIDAVTGKVISYESEADDNDDHDDIDDDDDDHDDRDDDD